MANLTKIQRTIDIPQAIKEYMKRVGADQSAISRLSKVSKSTLNYILKGEEYIPTADTNARISDKQYEKICFAIDYPLVDVKWRHFATDNFLLIANALDEARKFKKRNAIDGYSGLGKTYTARKCKNSFPKNTVLLTCKKSRTTKEFAVHFATKVNELLTKNKRFPIRGSKNSLIEQSCEALINDVDNALLIIDELENARDTLLPIIKEIADDLEHQVGITLLGIGSQKMFRTQAERAKDGAIQVNRRWESGWTELESNISEDIEKICFEMGIKNPAAQTWIKKRATNFGSLENMITLALDEAEALGTTVSKSLLEELFEPNRNKILD